MGENGAGKSTLLKMIAGALAPDAGRGVDRRVGDDGLLRAARDGRARPAIAPCSRSSQAHAPLANQGTLRSLAGAFGFHDDDVFKPIRVLSGGERARVALAKLLYDAPNLLVLDEPTNHLDIVTKRALVRALADYEGTLCSCRTIASSCARSRRACSSCRRPARTSTAAATTSTSRRPAARRPGMREA